MADGSTFPDLSFDIVELAPYVPAPALVASQLRETAFRANAWLPHQLDTLRERFAAGDALEDMAAATGHRPAGVATKLWELGLRRHITRAWSDLEDAEIVRRYRVESAAVIAQDFGRSCSAVYVRAQVLGLSEENPAPWSPWEDQQLKAGYAAGLPAPQVAALIGRTRGAVNTRASKLGLRNANTPEGWTQAEADRALELAYEGHLYLAIIEMLVAEGFPRRTKNGFGQRLRILGYGRGWGRDWTDDEELLLRKAYADGASLTPLQATLGRTANSIRFKAGDLGLQGTHKNKAGWRTEPDWTEAEEAVLKAEYGKTTPKVLAKRLGRSVGGIYQRANVVLGLSTGRYSAVTPEEDRAIGIAWRLGIGTVDVGVAIGRDPSIVSARAAILGIPFSSPDRPVKLKGGRRKGAPLKQRTLTLADILAMDDGQPAPVPRFTKKGKPLAEDPADRHHRSRPKAAPSPLAGPPTTARKTWKRPPRGLPWRKRWRRAPAAAPRRPARPAPAPVRVRPKTAVAQIRIRRALRRWRKAA